MIKWFFVGVCIWFCIRYFIEFKKTFGYELYEILANFWLMLTIVLILFA